MQQWKKIVQHPDVLTFERRTKEFNVRIECRKDEDLWRIFKTYYYKDLNYTEEFSAYSEEELHMLLEQLKKEPLLSVQEMKQRKRKLLEVPRIEVKRSYKEDNVEKWYFSVDDEGYDNFFILREYDVLQLDIIMHERYALGERKILEGINKILSIDNVDIDVKENVYYYRKKSNHQFKAQLPQFLFNVDQ